MANTVYQDDTATIEIIQEQINYKSHGIKLYAESDTFLLDSIVDYEYKSENDSVRQRKTVMLYDFPDQTTTIFYFWDEGKTKWLKDGKIVEALNNDGEILFSERFRWNSAINEWENGLWYWSGHQRNKYNSNGLLIESIEYNNHNNVEGSIYRKHTWEYDESGRKILSTSFTTLNDNSTLQKTSELKTLYDSINNRRIKTAKHWDYEHDALLHSNKEIVYLDSLGNEIVYENYNWDVDKNSWVPKSRATNLLNSENQTTGFIKQKWDEERNNWVNFEKSVVESNHNTKTTFQYNWYNKWNLREAYKVEKRDIESSDFDLVETSYVKHNVGSDYIPHYRDLIKNDEKGREIGGESYRWNTETKKWENGSKHETIYDDKNNTKIVYNYRSQDKTTWELTSLFFRKYNRADQLLFSKNTYFNQDKNDVSGRSTVYYYTGYERTAISSKALLNVTFYPNPSNGIINIEGLEDIVADITVFTAQGRKIMEPKGSEISQLDLSAFKKGFYLIRIKADNAVKTTPILLE